MPGALLSLVRKNLIRFYQLMLNLYPRQYRIKFGREMQAVFSEIICSNNDSSKTAVIFGRELRDLPLSLAKSWMEVLQVRGIYCAGVEDPVEKGIRAFYRKQKLRRVGKIGATLIILTFLYYGCSYTYTMTKIAQAKNHGVYPTAEEGMHQLIDQGYIGIQRATIYYAGPDSPYGNPFVWYVVAEVYASKRADGSDMGRNGCDNPGVFFVQTDDGWARVSEGTIYLGRLAHWMRVFGMAGPGQPKPSIDLLGSRPMKFCRTS